LQFETAAPFCFLLPYFHRTPGYLFTIAVIYLMLNMTKLFDIVFLIRGF